MLVYGDWGSYYMHNLGSMYMLPDLISLIRVPNLSPTTLKHHYSVVILTALNWFVDYSKDTYWRGMVIYAYLSMCTGIVNFYLGYQKLIPKNREKQKTVAKIALYNYAVCLLVNWSYQLYIISKWIFSSFPLWGLYINMIMIYVIVIDDIDLFSFLVYVSYDFDVRPYIIQFKQKCKDNLYKYCYKVYFKIRQSLPFTKLIEQLPKKDLQKTFDTK